MAIYQIMSSSTDAIPSAPTDLTEPLSNADSSSLSNSPIEKKRRKELIIFIRVLLDHLEQHDPNLRQAVRNVITHTIRENRNGNPMYQPLACSVQRRARAIVGEWHWSRVASIIVCTKQMSRSKKTNLKRPRPVISKSA
jgi:hypothetical protein